MSSSVFSAVSIPVSDSDSDSDGPAAKLRVRARRRRKRPGIHGGAGICRRIVRAAMRWWPVLLFVPAVVLLVFEASSTGRKPDGSGGLVEVVVHEEESHGNLNRLDPTLRVVNGVREPCLKILSPEAMQHLEFPAGVETNFPIKKVLYKSDSEASNAGGNDTLLRQYIEHARFNLFTGNQTLHEREESFKVKETAIVHCGFYSEKGGFKISDDDKSYMQTCKAVVSTCAFGGGDDLYQPIGMTEASLKKVCYVAFWDEITLSAQEAERKKVGDNHMIGRWRIIVVRDLPFSDQRLNGKIPKMLGHRLFPQARYSIWVDSKSQFRRDPLGVLEALLWRTNSMLAISEHGARSSVFDEGKAIVKKKQSYPRRSQNPVGTVSARWFYRREEVQWQESAGRSLHHRQGTQPSNQPAHVPVVQRSGAVHLAGPAQLPLRAPAPQRAEDQHVSRLHTQRPCEQHGPQAEGEAPCEGRKLRGPRVMKTHVTLLLSPICLQFCSCSGQ